MIRAPSSSQAILCTQATLKSLPKNSSSSSINFHLPISPLLVRKIILTIPTSSIPQQFFTFLSLRTTNQQFTPKNIFPTSTILPIQALSSDQGTRKY